MKNYVLCNVEHCHYSLLFLFLCELTIIFLTVDWAWRIIRKYCVWFRFVELGQSGRLPLETFVALGNQHAMRTHHIFICGPLRLFYIYPHYLINCTIFEGKKLLTMKYVSIFTTTVVWTFFILRRTEQDMIKNVYGDFMYSSSCSCPILMKVEFSGHIFEKYSNFVKMRPVGAELFHADRRAHGLTDRQTWRS